MGLIGDKKTKYVSFVEVKIICSDSIIRESMQRGPHLDVSNGIHGEFIYDLQEHKTKCERIFNRYISNYL